MSAEGKMLAASFMVAWAIQMAVVLLGLLALDRRIRRLEDPRDDWPYG
jgi:hypothetical protein